MLYFFKQFLACKFFIQNNFGRTGSLYRTGVKLLMVGSCIRYGIKTEGTPFAVSSARPIAPARNTAKSAAASAIGISCR